MTAKPPFKPLEKLTRILLYIKTINILGGKYASGVIRKGGGEYARGSVRTR
jgi:hypothetical protein